MPWLLKREEIVFLVSVSASTKQTAIIQCYLFSTIEHCQPVLLSVRFARYLLC